ncbi:MAG: U32 family peptidase [Solobacterium sp.]|nr:U32 family peptidase [Solobacterium sp.]
MNRKPFSKPELLAPAGDLARLKTAVDFGADAVYIGGKEYSLRSRASNFSREDILEGCAYARAHGSHVHVTVNEIPHDRDLPGLESYLRFLEEAGVHAVIVASPYIMKLANRVSPNLEVHISTQCSLWNGAAINYLVKTTGAARAVLGRECTLDEVRRIKAATDTDLEVFIHGGMCVNCSGRCTLSNRMTLRDANRGGCAQSCRWNYDVYAGERRISREDTLFTMGSKDLCAVEWIASLMELGVASMKIEGRMKTEYYVASIVSAYRHLIDELYEYGSLSDERMTYHRREVLAAQNREVWGGNYNGRGGAESIIYHANSDADVSHSFLGTVISYDGEAIVVETRNPFAIGDMVEVMEPGKENRMFQIEELRDEYGLSMDRSKVPMRMVQMKVPFAIGSGALLRKGMER